ncbi:MAG: tRNA (adenosine(37)-N6)-threonylcarbamoyltransferase complex dimerization subunit type 1 TsaB [Acidobacteriota bacterium]|nr:tRNA (adenosine(37)-N6)-threonylcarbamoyltransferase complex dimerization subunit type 1 TsaB [Acidobacteriota bacterium]
MSEEPIILGLDTSTEVGSVAIMRGDALLSDVAGDGNNKHSARILCEVDEALRQAGMIIKDVELFAVARGPGSFTGLRSGIALGLAFASTLKRPVYGIPTLRAVAAAAAAGVANCSQVWALLPAGRSEVLAQLFRVGGEEDVDEIEEASHISPAALLERALKLRGAIKWCGRGAEMHAQAISEYARTHSIEYSEAGENLSAGGEERRWVIVRAPGRLAATVARMALREFREGRVPGGESVRAIYVRAADAELKK